MAGTLPGMVPTAALPSWRDTATTRAITDFVAAATQRNGPGHIPEHERIAVFDNDGTLWPEKPMPVQSDFIIRNFAKAAQRDAALRDRQPFKAAYEHDLGWLGRAMVKHYQGDDGDLKLLIGALSETSAGVDAEVYAEQVLAFFADAEHPRFKRPYMQCAFQPMIELLRDLEILRFAAGGDGRPALRLVLRHDDAEREVDDQGGADHVLGAGFTEISVRDDWATVFAP